MRYSGRSNEFRGGTNRNSSSHGNYDGRNQQNRQGRRVDFDVGIDDGKDEYHDEYDDFLEWRESRSRSLRRGRTNDDDGGRDSNRPRREQLFRSVP